MEEDSDPPSSPILGTDAPHDRNWNQAVSNTTVVNQAYELPEAKTVDMRKVLPPLDSSENFGRWYEAVLSVLEPQNLHNLINVEIPRPFRDDTDAKAWYLISQKVATFLKESVDSALVKAILDDNTCVFADEFMAALKNHLLGRGHSTMQNSAFDVWEAKRSDYDTTGAFLRAMKRRLTRGMRHHAVKPWDAYIVVSRELSKWPEVELAIYRYNCGTSKSQLPDDVTTADFDEFCRYITDWIDRFGYHDSSSDEDL